MPNGRKLCTQLVPFVWLGEVARCGLYVPFGNSVKFQNDCFPIIMRLNSEARNFPVKKAREGCENELFCGDRLCVCQQE